MPPDSTYIAMASGRRLLLILRPAAHRGETVHAGAMGEGGLRRRDVARLSRPGLLRRRLQRASIAEGDRPRQRAKAVDGIEIGSHLDIGLTAGQESDAGYRHRHAALEQPNR